MNQVPDCPIWASQGAKASAARQKDTAESTFAATAPCLISPARNHSASSWPSRQDGERRPNTHHPQLIASRPRPPRPAAGSSPHRPRGSPAQAVSERAASRSDTEEPNRRSHLSAQSSAARKFAAQSSAPEGSGPRADTKRDLRARGPAGTCRARPPAAGAVCGPEAPGAFRGWPRGFLRDGLTRG